MEKDHLEDELVEDTSHDSEALIKMLTLTSIAGAFIDQTTVPIARNLGISSFNKEVLHHIKKYDLSRPRYVSERPRDPKFDHNTYPNV